MPNKIKYSDKIVPPVWKNQIRQPGMLRFRFRERIKILFGGNVEIALLVLSTQCPGTVECKMAHRVIKESKKKAGP